ncbi:MSHA biogenesis protein MshG [Desulfosarcina widdelii]|uniref:MSHA biogenesis protein MshG n=1 Tax=Desulfosarcina widdelii TaxID=947919 RepID=A0A5K7Z4A1_9BACT|nr:type II secretion system F family protein [Desulfosarcina widdelii]BBO74773.1 MSHA biogenesis protein MshG [Desulfosarcina widdelii]
MPRFKYHARSAAGALVEGAMEAASASVVANQLTAGGSVPLRIAEEAAASTSAATRKWQLGGQRVNADDLILFCRQMYSLAKAGVPLLRALRGLEDSAGKLVMVDTLSAIQEDLESGRDLTGALGRHPDVFPPLVVNMIRVGESSGKLDRSFDEVANYLTREKQTADQIKSALRYPSFVLVAIAVAVTIITLFVIPAFEKLFSAQGAQLPLPTRIILGISNFAVSWWWAILIGLAAVFFAWRAWVATESGRLIWDRFKLHIPVVGGIIHRATLVRFARGFAMAFGAGVPLIQALGLTARAVGNQFVAKRLDKLRRGVERGDTLTRSAAASEMFTPLVLQMLSVGEETGSVDSMLLEVGDFYAREIDYDISRLSSAIEPILIVVIGAMVLVLALGVFLPMWNMATVMRGG